MADKSTKAKEDAIDLRERFRRLRARVGDPLRWDDIDKVLVVLAIQLPAAAPLFLRSRALLADPSLEPYFDREVMRWTSFMLGGFLIFVALAVAVGLPLRNRENGRRRYLTTVVTVWWITAAMGVYLHGPATSPLLVLVPLISLTSLLLFNPRIATTGFAVGIVLIVGTAIAERVGLIPYAPIFARWPVVDGRVADPWAYSNLAWTTLGSMAVFVVFAQVLRRERRQAAEVTTLSTQLRSELRQAADYVSSLLPRPIHDEDGLTVEWCFVPSAELGGDAFTVLWLDEEHFAIALLDVSGHGVGAALHGVSAIHAVRGRGLGRSDPTDPSAVLAALNQSFDMDEHGGLFLTAWYGVFGRTSRRLRYASGGHPPAILRVGATRTNAKALELATGGPLVGVMPGAHFETQEIELGPFAELFVFSDGIFEVVLPSGEQMEWKDFVETLTSLAARSEQGVADVVVEAIRRRAARAFDDDVSLLRVEFPAQGALQEKGVLARESEPQAATECDLRVEQSPEGLRAASELMRCFALEHGIPESASSRLDVALEEILSNAVRHAFPELPPARRDLRLHLDVLGEALRATVIDNGPPFDPVRFKPTPVASSLSESELGGWGIRLVGEMVDEMRYWRSDECNCLELVVRPQAGPDRQGSHVHEEQREWRGSVEIREIEKGDGLRHLALSGRLDLAGTQAIETQFAALTSGAKQTAIVDVREVTFLASLGLRMLVSSARTLVKSGAKLVVLGPRPAVRLVLETAGLAAILPIAANDAEAIALATS